MTQPSTDIVPTEVVQNRVRSSQGTHISPAEWQWIILMSSILVLLAFLPLIVFALRGTGDAQFIGILHNFIDGGTYLSKMRLGLEGQWVVTFQHTSEPHQGGFIQVIYLLLGHLSRLTAIPPLVIFHVARLGASLLMYAALYQLGAVVWTRVRPRRLFFAFAAIGSGFGWLLSGPLNSTEFPDLTLPEAFPFYSSLMNVHFPLTLAFIAMLVATLITVLRPGAESEPTYDQALPVVSLLSLGLAMLFPQALVPIGGAMALYCLIAALQTRRLPVRLLRWLFAIGLPALPFFAYYMFLVTYNPAMAEWNRQNVTLAPALPGGLFILLTGFGIPMLLALPGIWRAVRRFELDGDRLMLLWLVVAFVAIFLPTNVQRRFAVGLAIPVAYFATRAVEDLWIRFVSRRRRVAVFTVVIALTPISLAFALFAPLILFNVDPQQVSGVMLERDYVSAFQWLEENSSEEDVVLAAPDVSIWVPGYTGDRVVYGHPYETLDAETKQMQVNAWFAGTSAAECEAVVEDYGVDFILYGPQEQRLGTAEACLRARTQVATFGSVTIYAP